MCTTSGTIIELYNTVKVWYWKFKSKDHNIQEFEHSCWPADVDEACQTTQELAKELDVSAMFISHTIHHINLTYKYNPWLLHELTQADKFAMTIPRSMSIKCGSVHCSLNFYRFIFCLYFGWLTLVILNFFIRWCLIVMFKCLSVVSMWWT